MRRPLADHDLRVVPDRYTGPPEPWQAPCSDGPRGNPRCAGSARGDCRRGETDGGAGRRAYRDSANGPPARRRYRPETRAQSAVKIRAAEERPASTAVDARCPARAGEAAAENPGSRSMREARSPERCRHQQPDKRDQQPAVRTRPGGPLSLPRADWRDGRLTPPCGLGQVRGWSTSRPWCRRSRRRGPAAARVGVRPAQRSACGAPTIRWCGVGTKSRRLIATRSSAPHGHGPHDGGATAVHRVRLRATAPDHAGGLVDDGDRPVLESRRRSPPRG